MKLSELFEAKHRKDISPEKAIELIEVNCKSMDPKKPFWRGSYNTQEDAYLIQGELGGRASANTSNYYTVLMDHFLPPLGFPKRSQSVIFTTSQSYASDYGYLYAIFPFDGVPIGVVNALDIWHLFLKIGAAGEKRIDKWNDFFERCGIPDYSFEDLVQGIKDTLADPDDRHYRDIEAVFEEPESVEKLLEKAYTPPSLDVDVKTAGQVQRLSGEHELWTSGRCIALSKEIWEEHFG